MMKNYRREIMKKQWRPPREYYYLPIALRHFIEDLANDVAYHFSLTFDQALYTTWISTKMHWITLPRPISINAGMSQAQQDELMSLPARLIFSNEDVLW